MTRIELKTIFEQKYDAENWKALLTAIFPKREFFATPEEVRQEELQQHRIAKSIKRFGRCVLEDKTVVAFYEAELVSGRNVTRNRVGLRNLLHADVIPGDVDAILAVYFNPQARDWRVSLISKSLSWDEESQVVRFETHPKRYTFVLGETETVRTPVERFEILFHSLSQKASPELEDLLKAFSVERVSNEFFKEYRQHFERFEAFLIDSEQFVHFLEHARGESEKEKREEAERLARNFAKKLLGRIVFLYFLQKKGWLGVPEGQTWGAGAKDFLSQLFQNFMDKNDFYTGCLVPLFSQTLNRKRAGDLFEINSGRALNSVRVKIPYLNGGLFDRDPIEPVDVQFKQPLFADLFEFFDRFNFTIDENSPDDQDVGIDPEMLGLIFENLLEDNRKKGTYYTPKEVVHYMCKESLRLHLHRVLQNKASAKELEEVDAFVTQIEKVDLKTLEKLAGDIERALSAVKICDPAIGSGAFPMGMVYEILRLKQDLPGKRHFDYSEEKFKIVQNSIYGVDIDQGAVDIARLRFWLALIVDEDLPKPLPNLDYKIMQGDSLKEEFEGIPLDRLTEPDMQLVEPAGKTMHLGEEFEPAQKTISFTTDEKEKLKYWVKEYYNAHDQQTKKELHERIGKFIHRELAFLVDKEKFEIEGLIERANKSLEDKLKTLSDKARERYRQTSKEAKTIVRLQKELELAAKKEQTLHEVQEFQEKPYFLWHLFFHDVLLEKDGFDIVIANPPYGVKVENTVKEKYRLGSKDSYGVFTSMALQKLVRPGGVLCFIISDTWLTIKSHLALRKQVLQWQLRKIIRLHPDCFKATVNACILTVVKESPPEAVMGTGREEPPPNPLLGKEWKLLGSPFKKRAAQKISPLDKGGLRGVIAADLTNLSTRKNVPEFRNKLYRLDRLAGTATPEYAVYTYPQSLPHINSNLPIIVGSPRLFQLLNDTTCETETTTVKTAEGQKEVTVRKIALNGKKIRLLQFGDIAEVKQGLATGDNHYYLYQNPEARGSYKNINEYRQFLLTEADLAKIHADEALRLKIIEHGFHKSKDEKPFDPQRWFGGRYIVPYDKGGESDTDEGWLPNYYVPTDYFLDWSSEAVARLKTLTTAERNKFYGKAGGNNKLCSRFQNKETYFRRGVTFSPTGIYAATFRYHSPSVYDKEGSCIFCSHHEVEELLAILCSKLTRYIQ